MTRKNDDIAALSFEDALAHLEKIVDRLEKGDVALEEAISIYQRGDQLRAHCDKLLKQAEVQILKITGGDSLEPLDAPEVLADDKAQD